MSKLKNKKCSNQNLEQKLMSKWSQRVQLAVLRLLILSVCSKMFLPHFPPKAILLFCISVNKISPFCKRNAQKKDGLCPPFSIYCFFAFDFFVFFSSTGAVSSSVFVSTTSETTSVFSSFCSTGSTGFSSTFVSTGFSGSFIA